MTGIWSSADAYEAYMGRWSRAVAKQFVPWLAVPPDRAWLDVGCGTGALTRTILDLAESASVLGADSSEVFVTAARATIEDGRARFLRADAEALPELGVFDAVVSGLLLNFLRNPATAVQRMVELTRPGGVVGAYVWDYAGRMEIMRYFWDAAVELDPAAGGLDEGRRASICNPEALKALFSRRLASVEVTAVEVPAVFPTFDAYWQPFLGGVGSAPAYVTSLPTAGRDALRERLRARVPAAADGSIELTCRAWAVKGLHA